MRRAAYVVFTLTSAVSVLLALLNFWISNYAANNGSDPARSEAISTLSWDVAWFFLVLPVWWTFDRLRRAYRTTVERQRVRENRCRRCGYELHATPERCPECGMTPAAK